MFKYFLESTIWDTSVVDSGSCEKEREFVLKEQREQSWRDF